MKQHATFVTSLLSIVFFTFHLADVGLEGKIAYTDEPCSSSGL